MPRCLISARGNRGTTQMSLAPVCLGATALCVCVEGRYLGSGGAMCRSGAQGAFTMQSSDMESVAKEWQNKNVHFLTSGRCVTSTGHLPKVNGLGLFQKCSFQWYRVASMPDQCLRQSRYHADFTSPSAPWTFRKGRAPFRLAHHEIENFRLARLALSHAHLLK